MARYTGPACRLCRRQGEKLMLKGERCTSRKCALERRSLPPGRQRPQRRKISDRGLQLREKQKARHTYGILERQFRKYFAEAEKHPGLTGENLIQILEMRLDNVVYRLGFADSRRQARQIVRHRHISVTGRRVDIPSYLVKSADLIAWRESGISTEYYKRMAQQIGDKIIPEWLSLDREKLSGQVLAPPNRSNIDLSINEKVIVEYYSR
jgi:small subunit ribosomal protein S4